MGVPLFDSLNYNIFDMSTLPLHNLLQRPTEVPGNQRENARILSKQVKNIGDIFSLSQNLCWSVCVAPILYIAPEEIVQRIEIGAVQLPAPAPIFFLSGKWFEMTRFLKWVSIKSNQISHVCLNPILLKPKFRKFFHRRELGEGFFFQYLPINRDCLHFSPQKLDRYARALWVLPIRRFSLDAGSSLKTRRNLNLPICGSYVIVTLLLGHLWHRTLNCSPYKQRTSLKFFCVL